LGRVSFHLIQVQDTLSKPPTRLEVVADGAKWSVREQGIGRLTSHVEKTAAIKAARDEAAAHPPCVLIIRADDGSVEHQESFQRQ
jgi:hypothetical protein